MSDIFARASPRRPAVVSEPVAVAPATPVSGQAPRVILIVAIAGLGGLAAGAIALRTLPARPQVEAKAAPRPAPALASQAQPPARAEPSVALAEAAPPPVATIVQPLAAESAPRTDRPLARPHSGKAETVAARRRARPRTRLVSAASAEGLPPIRLPVPVARSASCQEDTQSDECRQALLQADRHLRAVYERAIRRGVSRSTLVDYRDRWSDLRERDTDNPTRLIQSYGALAYDLGRERADPDGPEAASRAGSASGLKALADLLLPWR